MFEKISDGIQSSTTHGKGGIRNIHCGDVSSPEMCRNGYKWEYFDESQIWKIDNSIKIQCII